MNTYSSEGVMLFYELLVCEYYRHYEPLWYDVLNVYMTVTYAQW